MMNIKRILSILLALVCVGVLVCSLCACNGEGSGEENEGGASSPFYVNYKNVKIELDKKGQPVKYKKLITGKCTAYSSEQSTVGTVTSTGMKAQVGVVAVNPKVIPYGTKLYIVSPDGKTVYGYAIAGDTGGGVRKNELVCDLFMDTIAECIQFGRRTMNVYILE